MYHDLRLDEQLSAAIALRLPPKPSRQQLDAIERRVVVLALNDKPASLRNPGRREKLARLVFGGRPANRLADPRLETLRRYVVAVRWRRTAVADAAEDDLADMGFQPAALAAVYAEAEAHRRSTTSPFWRVASGISGVAAILWAWFGLMALLDDPLISAIAVGIGVVTLVGLLRPGARRIYPSGPAVSVRRKPAKVPA